MLIKLNIINYDGAGICPPYPATRIKDCTLLKKVSPHSFLYWSFVEILLKFYYISKSFHA